MAFALRHRSVIWTLLIAEMLNPTVPLLTAERVGGYRGYRVNSFRNSSSDRRRPSSVSTSDFDLFTGLPIRPF